MSYIRYSGGVARNVHTKRGPRGDHGPIVAKTLDPTVLIETLVGFVQEEGAEEIEGDEWQGNLLEEVLYKTHDGVSLFRPSGYRIRLGRCSIYEETFKNTEFVTALEPRENRLRCDSFPSPEVVAAEWTCSRTTGCNRVYE
jgi:hypothetical protein